MSMSDQTWIYRLSKYVELRAEVLAKEVYRRGEAVLAVWPEPPSKDDLRGLADILNPP
jgi:hypothetical protein